MSTGTKPRWTAGDKGVLTLPSGRLVRGRGLRDPMPSGHPPTLGVYLLGKPPPEFGWPARWVRWPDFRLPTDRALLRTALEEILEHDGRAEIACGGGRGRTGTALACLAVLDGLPADRAVAYVREHYHPKAVEMPWQHRFARSAFG